MRSCSSILVGSLTLLLFGDAVLRWTPKVGDQASFTIDGTIKTRGMHLKMGGTSVERTTSVDDKTVVTVADSDVTVKLPLGMRRKTGRSPETTIAKPDGTVQDVQDAQGHTNESSLRYARLGMLVFPEKPVAVGRTWTVEMPQDARTSMTGVRLEYTLVGAEAIGGEAVWKIGSKGGETGESKTTVEATFWIDPSTGAQIHVHSKITDAAFPGDGGHVDAETDTLRRPNL